MPTQLQRIKDLIKFLPKKDIEYAKSFLEKKDYESLKDLTWSSLQRLENALKKDKLPEKYIGIDVEKLRDLALECDEFYYLLFPEEMEIEDDFEEDDEIVI